MSSEKLEGGGHWPPCNPLLLPPVPSRLSALYFIVEINECLESWDVCDKNAVCIDTLESYECRCKVGYHEGIGKECIKGGCRFLFVILFGLFLDKINSNLVIFCRLLYSAVLRLARKY